MKNILKILSITLLLILLAFSVLPYIIPSQTSRYSSAQEAALANPELHPGTFLKINSNKIYLEDFNSTSTKVITFIHGFGGSTYSWRKNKQYFVDNGYRVIAIDLLGFGLSSGQFSDNYSHDAQAKLIKSVLDKLNITKSNIVGHSMGGDVVIFFAMNYPEMVDNLIIVDGAINSTQDNQVLSYVVNTDITRRWGNIGLSGYLTRENFGNALKSAYYKTDTVTSDVFDNYYLPLEIKGWQDSLLAITRDGSKNSLPNELSTLKMKTLIIWGSNDPWIPIEQGRTLNQEIVGSKFVEITNSGHLPMEEGSEVFNNTLKEFLESL